MNVGIVVAVRTLLRETGASIVEYTLAVSLIVVVALGAVALVGESVLTEYDCVGTEMGDIEVRKRVNDKIKNSIALDNIEKKFADSCL